LSEKRLKIVLPVGIMLLGIIITFIIVKSRSPVKTRPPADYTPLVRCLVVLPEPHQYIVHTQGTVSPRTEASLVPEVSGRVVNIAESFASGGFFEKGDILLTIDPRDYELAVVAARSQVAQARVRMETEKAQAEVARSEWDELGSGQNSPLATRELQFQEAIAAFKTAEAGLEQAERSLERTRIRAPFAGRVRHKTADIGQYVTPGMAVAIIYAVDYVEIRLPIPDSELAYLDLPIDYRGRTKTDAGPEVHLYSEFAGQLHRWTGRIVRAEGEIDPTSRMVHVVAQVDDPYGQGISDKQLPLAVGMFVEAEILGRVVEDAMVIPRSAMRGRETVLVVDDSNRLIMQTVKPLRISRGEAVIGSGLEPGVKICISPIEIVTDSMKVRTVNVDQPVATDSNSPEDSP
jgi:multidrug efflux system membrane fusion protein